jgi:hypothetical protein
MAQTVGSVKCLCTLQSPAEWLPDGFLERRYAMDEKMNILMVDDQPGKLLTYEAMLGELGENLIKAHSGMEALARTPAENRHRPRAHGCEHARNGWLRNGADDSRSPTLSKHANCLRLRDSCDGPGPAKGISTGSCRLRFRSCLFPSCCGQR